MSQVANKAEVDALVKEKLMPMRDRVLDEFEKKHPHIFSVVNPMLANKKNKFGMQVVENNQVVGEYILHLSGLRVTDIETGKLDSEINHPFMGIIKPYASIERKTIENIISAEEDLKNDLFPTIVRYLPGVTIKFLP